MLEVIQIALLFFVFFDVLLILSVVLKRWNSTDFYRQTSKNKIVVLLTVYHEEDTIAETIKFLKAVVYDNVIQIVIVGNTRERDLTGLNPTLVAAQTLTKNYDKFKVQEYQGDNGIKAHQLNYAISKLNLDESTTWIYLMDIDTRFDQQTMFELLDKVEKGHRIIQQHAHFFRGYSESSILGKMGAVYQSRWTLTHEIARIKIFNLTKLGMYHLVGHGLCMQLEKLHSVGGFTEHFNIEDVHLGYVCTLLNEPVVSCQQLEGADSTGKLQEWWWQQYWWSRGVMQAPGYFLNLKEQNFSFSAYNYVQQIFAYWNFVRWLLNSSVIWFGLISSKFDWGFGWRFFAVFVTLYCLTFWISAVFYQRMGNFVGSKITYLVLCFVYASFRSLPVIHGLIDALFRVRREKYKTGHVSFGS